jgi:hypothetical protein
MKATTHVNPGLSTSFIQRLLQLFNHTMQNK